jgi:hypothetical protein
VVLSIRPEQLAVLPEGAAPDAVNQVQAQLLETNFLGDSSEHRLSAGGLALRMHSVPPRLDLPEQVRLQLAPEEFVVLAAAE